MTEDEAKEARCCGPEGCGREDAFRVRWCIGSACMAWRWDDVDAPREGPHASASGHCGLAGWVDAD